MVTIRRATEADVEPLTPLKAEVHALHVAARPDVFKAMTDREVGRWLRDRLAEKSTHVWLAEAGDAPIGYLMAAQRVREETSFSHERQWCEIDEVAVAEHGRAKGVARALIDRAAEHARALGVDTLELTTWAFNTGAQAAFARIGFVPMSGRHQRRA